GSLIGIVNHLSPFGRLRFADSHCDICLLATCLAAALCSQYYLRQRELQIYFQAVERWLFDLWRLNFRSHYSGPQPSPLLSSPMRNWGGRSLKSQRSYG